MKIRKDSVKASFTLPEKRYEELRKLSNYRGLAMSTILALIIEETFEKYKLQIQETEENM